MPYYKGRRDNEKTNKSRTVIGWAKKIKAIELLGGKCKCGESSPWRLDFHHLDKSKKENGIHYLRHGSWEKLETEVKKCTLLCKNCHADEHFKENYIKYIDEINSKIVKPNFQNVVDHKKVLKLNEKGLTQKDIANKLNCGPSTVCQILKSNGIHTKIKCKKILHQAVEIIDLRERGFTNVEIGCILDINRFTVPSNIRTYREKKMINSILDNDLYTFTVGQAVWKTFPNSFVKFNFTSRRSTPINEKFINVLNFKIKEMSKLTLSDEELDYLRKLNLFSDDYINYLSNYKFDPNQVVISFNPDENIDLATNFKIEISGSWASTIFWEVPLLAMISETYYETVDLNWNDDNQQKLIRSKGKQLSESKCIFADFGTRRRRDFKTQKNIVENLKKFDGFVGTSNVYLSMINGLTPIGTMSHQWIMGISGLKSLEHANLFALQYWNDVYKGKLNVMLPDTFGTDAFLKDFNLNMAEIYNVRQDSGSPFEFTDKLIKHYSSLGIETTNKSITFSDGLNVEKSIEIKEYCNNKINCVFGIGTHFTNDFENSPALNIVIKLKNIAENEFETPTEVVKLSDVPTKATGDPEAVRIAKKIFFNTPLDQKV